MDKYQTMLIEKLAAERIEAKFNGDFLNCRVKITVEETGKIKWQKFSFVFDSADDCQGSRLLPRSLKGAYSKHFADEAAKIIFAYSEEVAQEPINA